jgi:hypothetical protein
MAYANEDANAYALYEPAPEENGYPRSPMKAIDYGEPYIGCLAGSAQLNTSAPPPTAAPQPSPAQSTQPYIGHPMMQGLGRMPPQLTDPMMQMGHPNCFFNYFGYPQPAIYSTPYTTMATVVQSPWEDLEGSLQEVVLTPDGAAAVCFYYTNGEAARRETILAEVQHTLDDVISTAGGMHLVKQMLKLGPSAVRTKVWAALQSKLALSDMDATLVKALVTNIDCQEHVSLLHRGMTCSDVCEMFKSSEGSEILLHCVQTLRPMNSMFIFAAAVDQLEAVCAHEFASVTFQKALEAMVDEIPVQLLVADRVAAIGRPLCWNEYGCNVIAHVLKLTVKAAGHAKRRLIQQLK